VIGGLVGRVGAATIAAIRQPSGDKLVDGDAGSNDLEADVLLRGRKSRSSCGSE